MKLEAAARLLAGRADAAHKALRQYLLGAKLSRQDVVSVLAAFKPSNHGGVVYRVVRVNKDPGPAGTHFSVPCKQDLNSVAETPRGAVEGAVSFARAYSKASDASHFVLVKLSTVPLLVSHAELLKVVDGLPEMVKRLKREREALIGKGDFSGTVVGSFPSSIVSAAPSTADAVKQALSKL